MPPCSAALANPTSSATDSKSRGSLGTVRWRRLRQGHRVFPLLGHVSMLQIAHDMHAACPLLNSAPGGGRWPQVRQMRRCRPPRPCSRAPAGARRACCPARWGCRGVPPAARCVAWRCFPACLGGPGGLRRQHTMLSSRCAEHVTSWKAGGRGTARSRRRHAAPARATRRDEGSFDPCIGATQLCSSAEQLPCAAPTQPAGCTAGCAALAGPLAAWRMEACRQGPVQPTCVRGPAHPARAGGAACSRPCWEPAGCGPGQHLWGRQRPGAQGRCCSCTQTGAGWAGSGVTQIGADQVRSGPSGSDPVGWVRSGWSDAPAECSQAAAWPQPHTAWDWARARPRCRAPSAELQRRQR